MYRYFENIIFSLHFFPKHVTEIKVHSQGHVLFV